MKNNIPINNLKDIQGGAKVSINGDYFVTRELLDNNDWYLNTSTKTWHKTIGDTTYTFDYADDTMSGSINPTYFDILFPNR